MTRTRARVPSLGHGAPRSWKGLRRRASLGTGPSFVRMTEGPGGSAVDEGPKASGGAKAAGELAEEGGGRWRAKAAPTGEGGGGGEGGAASRETAGVDIEIKL